MNTSEEFDVPSWGTWENTVLKALGEKGFARLSQDLGSGVIAHPFYPKKDVSYPRVTSHRGAWEIQAQYQFPLLSRLSALLGKDLHGGVQRLHFKVSPQPQKGVPLYSANALNTLLGDVFLDAITTRYTVSTGLGSLFQAVNSYYSERKVKIREAQAELAWVPYTSEEHDNQLDEVAEFFQSPGYFTKLINFSATHIIEAGGNGVQEIGFLLSSLLDTLKALHETGVHPSEVLERSTISFSLGTDLFYDVAKIRAAKLTLKQLFTELEIDVDVAKTAFIGEEVRRHHTKTDPWVNILRSTVSGLSAGLGGVQAVQLLPHDTVYAGTSELGKRISRNIHHILMEESHIHRVQDPMAGSDYIESLTLDIAEKSWKKFQKIQSEGGLRRAISLGLVHSEIEESLAELRRDLRTRKKPITGTSEFPNPLEKKPLLLTYTQEEIESQNASLSELADISKEPKDLFKAVREGEIFENLREKGNAFSLEHKVFLLNLGSKADFTQRASFVKNVLGIAGIVPEEGQGGSDVPQLMKDFQSTESQFVCVVGTDEHYETLLPTLLPALKSAGARLIVLAQNPKDRRDMYEKRGVDRFVYMGCDVAKLLENLVNLGGK